MSSKITEELRDSLVRCVRAGLLNTVSYAALNAIADRIDAEYECCKEESAKLRELVKNMHGWLVVNYEKSYVIPLNGLNDIERDMRELGIEVE